MRYKSFFMYTKFLIIKNALIIHWIYCEKTYVNICIFSSTTIRWHWHTSKIAHSSIVSASDKSFPFFDVIYIWKSLSNMFTLRVCSYRMTVLRALPQLEKLDNVVVQAEEVYFYYFVTLIYFVFVTKYTFEFLNIL